MRDEIDETCPRKFDTKAEVAVKHNTRQVTLKIKLYKVSIY